MNKQLTPHHFILSMVLIFLLGLGYLAALYFFLNPRISPKSLTSFEPVTSEPISITLNLSSPDDNLLTFEPDLLISGKTSPGVPIILSFEDHDLSLEAGSLGDFSTTIKLQQGVNQFSVTAFDNLGNGKTESRTVYYSEEKI